MNNFQKAVINCYTRFINVWVDKYGYGVTHNYYLGYNYLIFYTNKDVINWEILEQLKEITDKNNTAWEISVKEGYLVIKFQK